MNVDVIGWMVGLVLLGFLDGHDGRNGREDIPQGVVISPAMTANVAELIPFLSNVPLPLAAGFTAFYAGFCSGDSATFP